jgi:hypothetical protein
MACGRYVCMGLQGTPLLESILHMQSRRALSIGEAEAEEAGAYSARESLLLRTWMIDWYSQQSTVVSTVANSVLYR